MTVTTEFHQSMAMLIHPDTGWLCFLLLSRLSVHSEGNKHTSSRDSPGKWRHNENREVVVYSAPAFKQEVSVLFWSLGLGCEPPFLARVGT